jgi:histone acetyltransferase (RNA polymerase elongator complex component)
VESQKLLIVPIFIPHWGCPFTCAFCNQNLIAGASEITLPDKPSILSTIDQFLSYKANRSEVEVAFFGGNFLGLKDLQIKAFLSIVQPLIDQGKVHGIRFSTRPDTVSKSKLDLLSAFTISAVELGIQSMDDKVLKQSKRGHTRDDCVKAIQLLKDHKFKVGVQMMIGLPGDSHDLLMESTEDLCSLSPDFARVYPLLVLKGSDMATWYKKGDYTPLALDHCIDLAAEVVSIFESFDIPIIRLGLQASEMMDDPEQVVAGPWHPAFGHLVYCRLMKDKTTQKINRFLYKNKGAAFNLSCNTRMLSRVRGHKNRSYLLLIKQYPGFSGKITVNDSLMDGEVKVDPVN